jgi:hypothetical protein
VATKTGEDVPFPGMEPTGERKIVVSVFDAFFGGIEHRPAGQNIPGEKKNWRKERKKRRDRERAPEKGRTEKIGVKGGV